MLYRFKSKATGDVIMLEATGRRVLGIIGKEPQARGILLPDQMPAAIAALQAAITLEEERARQTREARQEAAAAGRDDAGTGDADMISLRQRAMPFIDMMRRAMAAGKEIVWGV